MSDVHNIRKTASWIQVVFPRDWTHWKMPLVSIMIIWNKFVLLSRTLLRQCLQLRDTNITIMVFQTTVHLEYVFFVCVFQAMEGAEKKERNISRRSIMCKKSLFQMRHYNGLMSIDTHSNDQLIKSVQHASLMVSGSCFKMKWAHASTSKPLIISLCRFVVTVKQMVNDGIFGASFL